MTNQQHGAANFSAATKGAAMQATETTKNEMVSKLVAAWEDKNAKRAAQGAGLSLMALSLAACGGSSTPVVTPDPVVPTVTPVNLALTTSNDLFDSADFTTAADTVTGTNLTYASTDVIADATSGDGDTLTISTDADIDATPTVVGIENVVFDSTMEGTGVLNIAVDNISGATITVNTAESLNLVGTDIGEHDVVVTGAGDVTIIAGTNVMTIAVTELADAATSVDAGSATSVTINGATGAADQVLDLTVNGNIALKTTVATDINITATVASEVSIATADIGAIDTIVGDANTTLVLADLNDFTADSISGVALVSAATVDGDTDASKISSAMELTAVTAGSKITFADAANVTLAAGTTALTAELVDDTATTTHTAGSIDLTLAGNYTGVISMGTTQDYIGTVNVTAGAVQTALDIRANTTNGVINIDGSNAVTLASTATASAVDASELIGKLTATASASLLDITGGLASDSITLGLAEGLAFDLNGGAGSYDTLVLIDADDLTTGSFSGFEILNVTGTANFLASQLSGSTLTVNGTGVVSISGSGADVDLTTIDLSGLQFSSTGTTVINVSAAADGTNYLLTQAFNITGSDVADAITGSANADTINGGAGADTLVGGDGADSITGGEGADVITGGAGNDVITLTETTSALDTVVVDDVTTAGIDVVTGFVAADAIKFFNSTSYLNATATDFDTGNATLADALADVSAAAKTASGVASSSAAYAVGFEYGGNSYVYIDGATDGYAAADDAVVQLVGTDLSTLSAADFIA